MQFYTYSLFVEETNGFAEKKERIYDTLFIVKRQKKSIEATYEKCILLHHGK